MTSKNSPIGPEDIKTPCNADWETMRGDDSVRFCEHCNLTVRDITGITNKDLRRLVRKAQGRLCVRYAPRKTAGVPLPLHQIRRAAGRVAAGAFGATLGLSSVWAYQQARAFNPFANEGAKLAHHNAQPLAAQGTAALRGAVTRNDWSTEANELVPVSQAKVMLTNQARRDTFIVFTDKKGNYELTNIPAGIYRLHIEMAQFETFNAHDIELQPGGQVNKDATLMPDSNGLMGVFTISYSTPLLEQVERGNMEEARELLFNGAKVNEKDGRLEVTPLHLAVERRSLPLVELLLSYGADPRLLERGGQTPLMQIAAYNNVDKGRGAAIIARLISAGAVINAQDDDNDTALMESVKMGDASAFKALLEAGALPDLQNDKGETALMLAAHIGNKDMLEALLEAGANAGFRDQDGKTALMHAYAQGHSTVADWLREIGIAE